MSKRKFAVTYTLPYLHRVVVGVLAESAESAIQTARTAFYAGLIWDNTEAMPLLSDQYIEQDSPIEFLAQLVDVFEADVLVDEAKYVSAARQSCALLIRAYADAETFGGSINWSDIDAAYAMALRASPTDAIAAMRKQMQETATALTVLDDFNDLEQIDELYDDHPALASALATLIPGFEYPDWSHRTIADVRRAAEVANRP